MSSLDLLLLLPIGLGFVFGLFKGLIRELTSLAAIVLGIYGAKLTAPFVSGLLMDQFHISAGVAKPVSYIVLFIAIGLTLLLVANMLDKFMESISLGGLNKFMGGVFGALKYALIMSVLLNVFNALDSKFSLLSAEKKASSYSYQPLLMFGPVLWEEAGRFKAEDEK